MDRMKADPVTTHETVLQGQKIDQESPSIPHGGGLTASGRMLIAEDATLPGRKRWPVKRAMQRVVILTCDRMHQPAL